MNLATIESHDLQQWSAAAEKATAKVETRLFIDVPPSDPFFSYADDDFLQVRLARYF